MPTIRAEQVGKRIWLGPWHRMLAPGTEPGTFARLFDERGTVWVQTVNVNGPPLYCRDRPLVASGGCPSCGFRDPWQKYRGRPGGPCRDAWHG